jgi:hypothetical protein
LLATFGHRVILFDTIVFGACISRDKTIARRSFISLAGFIAGTNTSTDRLWANWNTGIPFTNIVVVAGINTSE